MILAAGLSPAWQQIVRLDQLSVGEVNRAREVHWCASGKVLNVVLALKHLAGTDSHNESVSSRTSSEILGLASVGGDNGAAIRREFNALHVPMRWIDSAVSTRVCTTILDSATGQTTELVENAQPISADELERFVAAFQDEARRASVVVLAGSLPTGAPSTLYRDLMSAVNCPVIVDAQRALLLAALEARPFLVKPNREELGNTLGMPVGTTDELHAAMFEIIHRGARYVVVSEGKERVWIGSNEGIFSAVPPTVEVVNPIGCGDCLAAGITWGVACGENILSAVRVGMGAAAENATQLLPARFDRRRVAERSAAIQFVECTPSKS